MRSLAFIALAVAVGWSSPSAHGHNSRIVQIRLPDEDVTCGYYEGNPFTVKLSTKTASVEGVNFYVGNAGVAVEFKAHPNKGLVFQGQFIDPPHEFKKGSTVKVLPGYKRVQDLPPGTVYVELPGVTFEVPDKKK